VSNFFTDVIEPHPRFNAVVRVADPALLDPFTRQAALAIVADAGAMGQPLMIFETYRSEARQWLLFKQGATRLSKVGVHHYGLACDFAKDVAGEPYWGGDWKFLRDLAVKHGLISGYDWGQPEVKHSFVDADHVQRITLADQDRLFSGLWYPDENYHV